MRDAFLLASNINDLRVDFADFYLQAVKSPRVLKRGD
jgi:hypothetical protein